jgi:hypothetical protein
MDEKYAAGGYAPTVNTIIKGLIKNARTGK